MSFLPFRTLLGSLGLACSVALLSACSGDDPEVTNESSPPLVGSDFECRDGCVIADDEPALSTVLRTHQGQVIRSINTQVQSVIGYEDSFTFMYTPELNERVAIVLDSYSQNEASQLSIPASELNFDTAFGIQRLETNPPEAGQRPDLDLTVRSTDSDRDLLRESAGRGKSEALVLELEANVQYEITVAAWDVPNDLTREGESRFNEIGAFNLKVVNANRQSLEMTGNEILMDYYCLDRLFCRSSLNRQEEQFYIDQEENSADIDPPNASQGAIDFAITSLVDTKAQYIINTSTGDVRQYRRANISGFNVSSSGLISRQLDKSTSRYKFIERIEILPGAGNEYPISLSVDYEGSFESSNRVEFAGELAFRSEVMIR